MSAPYAVEAHARIPAADGAETRLKGETMTPMQNLAPISELFVSYDSAAKLKVEAC